MIKSIINIIIFISIVSVFSFAVTQFAKTNDEFQIILSNIEITFSPIAVIIAAVVGLIVIWLVFKICNFLIATYRFLNGDETAISRYFDRSREKKGFQALSDGMIALALGENRTATIKAYRANKLLGKPEVTNLLSAQAAEQSGDRKEALRFYKALINQEKTKFVGILGIMKQKLEDGDKESALELAHQANSIKPKDNTVLTTLFELQVEKNNWTGAQKTLNTKYKSGLLPKDIFIRRNAILNLATAKEDSGENSITAAINANKASPELIPAAVLTASIHMKNRKKRLATNILRKAWDKLPHPDLAAAFANLEPSESANERFNRFKPWIKVHKDTPEVIMLEAELALAAENYTGARKIMGELAETSPTARSLTIMAAVERGTGAAEAVVRGWLAKALGAKYGPMWTCTKCNNIYKEWLPICEQCKAFDTLEWMETEIPSKIDKSTELLPLIIGELGKEQDPSTEDIK
jgi:HemY protein|tara:strand:+ start:945 stop:2345 length:1401 start_codon:yes stop_codon:yes gene_type:complete